MLKHLKARNVDGVNERLLELEARPVVHISRRIEDGVDPLDGCLQFLFIEDVCLGEA